jgi:tetratricopeptide (TPR) repeat protein
VQHYELGQLEEAQNHYNYAIKNNKEEGMLYFNRGLVKSRLNKVEEAIEDYSKALDFLSSSETDMRY